MQKVTEKNMRFEIVNDTWILNITKPLDEDEIIAYRLSAIKSLKCFHQPAEFGINIKEKRYYIVLTAGAGQEMRFEYEPNQEDEYLKHTSILRTLLFFGEDVSSKVYKE